MCPRVSTSVGNRIRGLPISTSAPRGVCPKADIVLEISKGGCVILRTRGEGVQKPEISADVLNGSPLICNVLTYVLTKRRERIIGLELPPLQLLLGVEHQDVGLGLGDGDVHDAVVLVPSVAHRELLPKCESPLSRTQIWSGEMTVSFYV